MATYLTRTFGTPTSTKKFTISVWVKRTTITSSQALLQYNGDYFYFNDDTLDFETSIGRIKTNRLFRDPNAWYHLVVTADTTLATADDRFKMYVNGVQETSFASRTNPSQNADFLHFNSANAHKIGQRQASPANDLNFRGILSHYHFCDGYAYDASAFGSTDSVTGEWKINTSPSVSYGNNGFFILKDGNSVTDQSGNSNNFTAYGNLTNTEDNPSNNFCTFNGVNPYSGTLSNGNLKMSQTSFNYNVQGTLGMESGKYYWEYKIDGAYGEFGVCEQGKAGQSDPQGNIGFYFLYNNGNTTGYIWNNATAGSQSSEITIPAFASGMIINLAYDADNKALYIGQNGTWLNSGDPTSGASTTGALITNLYPRFGGTIVPFCGHGTSSTTANYEANFGNGYFGTTAISSEGTNASGIGKFEYDVPNGNGNTYTALSTKGLNL